MPFGPSLIHAIQAARNPSNFTGLSNDVTANTREMMANDPRAIGSGYDTRRFTPSEPNSDISRAETFGVNTLNEGRRFDQAADSIFTDARQGDLSQRLTDARRDANAYSDVNEGRFERSTRGMALTDRQQKAAKQRMSLNRAVSEVSALAGTRKASAATAREAQKSGVDMEGLLLGQEAAAQAGLANAEGQRIVREANEKARDDAERFAFLGNIGGTLLSFLTPGG